MQDPRVPQDRTVRRENADPRVTKARAAPLASPDPRVNPESEDNPGTLAGTETRALR